MNLRPLLPLLALVCASACASAPDDSAEAESAATARPRAAYYQVVERGGRLYAQLANATATPCADGRSDVRCPLAEVDLTALRLSPERRDAVNALLPEDVILVYGKPQAVVRSGTKQMRLVATRAFENLLRVFPEGDLYEITKAPAPAACELARMVAAPPGVFAPPTLRTFQGTCTHIARALNSARTFAVDEPNWASREPWLPAGASVDVTLDLDAGASVIANGHWMSNLDAPFTHPTPVQMWRDVARPEGEQ